MNHKLGQLMIVGIEGTTLSQDESEFLISHNIGGVILMGRNVESPEQVHELTNSIQNLKNKMQDKVPFFIGIDMEGGRVHRAKAPFTIWPSAQRLGELDSTSLSFKFAQAMGEELRSVGVNLDFAPCVDILSNPNNPVIGDRSLGSDPQLVTKHASALVRGFIKANILCCAKHFPGHGNTAVDSHEELPRESTDLKQLIERELVPFKKIFKARLDMAMTAHILFENIDPDHPVTFSEKIIKKIMREECRYRGLIVTDDLDMKALRNYHSVEDIPIKALNAGCEILLYCNEPNSHKQAIESLQKGLKEKTIDMNHVDLAYQKVVQLKKEKIVPLPTIALTEAMAIVGNERNLALAEAIKTGIIPEDLQEHT